MKLLIFCGKNKAKLSGLVPARKLYRGRLVREAIKVAEKFSLEPLILSAKYGWISPDTLIEYYDERFTQVYQGTFPEGKGYYLGGPRSIYFRKVPKTYTPLTPGVRGAGDIYSALASMLRGELVPGQAL